MLDTVNIDGFGSNTKVVVVKYVVIINQSKRYNSTILTLMKKILILVLEVILLND